MTQPGLVLNRHPSALPTTADVRVAPLSSPVAPAAPEPLGVLAALVRDVAARPERWHPQVRFQTEQRWWTRLDGPPGIDVWLLSWLATQGTELHDHGAAAAAFTVVRGALTEVRAATPGLTTRTVRAGQVQTVAAGVVHDVVNRDAEPAVSIHAYAPRLSRMTYYRWVDTRLEPVSTVTTTEPETAE